MVKHWGLFGEHVSFIKGDLHQAGYEKKPNFDYINVPSVFGSSDWMINNGFPRATPGAYFEHISGLGRTTGFIELDVKKSNHNIDQEYGEIKAVSAWSSQSRT